MTKQPVMLAFLAAVLGGTLLSNSARSSASAAAEPGEKCEGPLTIKCYCYEDRIALNDGLQIKLPFLKKPTLWQ
jgi:hypothetical protein